MTDSAAKQQSDAQQGQAQQGQTQQGQVQQGQTQRDQTVDPRFLGFIGKGVPEPETTK